MGGSRDKPEAVELREVLTAPDVKASCHVINTSGIGADLKPMADNLDEKLSIFINRNDQLIKNHQSNQSVTKNVDEENKATSSEEKKLKKS
jgi:hypothetical protein